MGKKVSKHAGKLIYSKEGLSETKIIEKFEPIVKKLIRSVLDTYSLANNLPNCTSFEDLQQEVNMAVVKCFRRYNTGGSASLETYAHERIKGAVIDALRRMHAIKRKNHTQAARDRLRYVEHNLSHPVSLSSNPLLVERKKVVDSSWENDEDWMMSLDYLIGLLPEIEKAVITQRYFEGMTFKEIGARAGLSESWAFQKNRRGLERMKKWFQIDALQAAHRHLAHASPSR